MSTPPHSPGNSIYSSLSNVDGHLTGVSSSNEIHGDIISRLPKCAVKKYNAVMNIIENSEYLGFDPVSRSLMVDGRPLENTNIVDLVVESLSNRKVSPKIPGWKTFVHKFKKSWRKLENARESLSKTLYDRFWSTSAFIIWTYTKGYT